MLLRLNTLCIVYFYTNLSEDLPPSPDYCFLLVRDLPSGVHRLSPERVATSHEHMLVVSPGKWRRGCGSDLEGEAETRLCPVPQNYAFLPTVVDGVLLPKMPEEMLAEKNFSTVPYIVGINKQEFGWILPLVRKCRPHRLSPLPILSPLPSVVTSPLISLVIGPFFMQTPLWDQGSCPLHTKVDISMETISDGPHCHLGDVPLETHVPTHSLIVLPSMNPEILVPGGLVEIIIGQMKNPRLGTGKMLGSSGE